jgi:FkbM family methyltransferase
MAVVRGVRDDRDACPAVALVAQRLMFSAATLARTLYPYGSTRRVLRGPVRGRRFVVEPGIGCTYALGSKAAAPRLFAKLVRPGMTVYDVGGNKGQMALLFASLVGPSGHVVTFEPAPSEFKSLQGNLALNEFTWVTAFNCAASDANGTLTFLFDSAHPTQGKLADVEPSYQLEHVNSVSVPALPLDDVCLQAPMPDFIKIDVEGAAAAVLRGAQQILQSKRPTLYLELHGPEEQAGVRDHLLTRGYRASTLDGKRVQDPTAGWFSPLLCFPIETEAALGS